MDMQMDPASALERISGVYEEAISQEDAFRRILVAVYQNGFQSWQTPDQSRLFPHRSASINSSKVRVSIRMEVRSQVINCC